MTGIYRKLSVRMWGDQKFTRLTQMHPSGQALWLYLLTGPHTGPIPGVFIAGRAAMAEALNWELEAFNKAMAEVLAEGLAEFDSKARLWFLPNALRHNGPASPNVVKSWRAQWSILPDCALRDRVAQVIAEELKGFNVAYLEAFRGVIGEGVDCASSKPSPNQEQEQEQDQKQALNTGSLSAIDHSAAVLAEHGVSRDDAAALNGTRALKGLHPIGRQELNRFIDASVAAGLPITDAAISETIDNSIICGNGTLSPSLQSLIAQAKILGVRNGVLASDGVTSA